MAIYSQIASFGGTQGAVYLGARSFTKLALNSYRDGLGESVGKLIALSAALGSFGVRFDSASTARSGGNARDVGTHFERAGRDVALTTEEPLKLEFTFGVLSQDAITDALAIISIDVSKIKFAIEAGNDRINCSAGDSTLVPAITRSDDFDRILVKHSLDRDTVARVEGMLLYSGLATAFGKMLATSHSISLVSLFPGVRFNGHIDFAVSSDAQHLFLKGTQGMSFPSDAACSCADVGNGVGPVQPGTATPDTTVDPTGGASVGKITIGGPTAVNPTSPPILGRRRLGEGDSGLYMPSDLALNLVQGPYPAVRVDMSENGFIGWKAAGFVDFNGLSVAMDAPRGCFFVELRFRAEVYGSVHIDLGKLGKIRVTEFSAEQSTPGLNSVRIAFYLVLGADGLYLKPVLENVNFAEFEVNLRVGTLIGTPFGIWGAVIGFIFDKILGSLIGSQIPNVLDLELRRYMAKAIIPLLNAQYAAQLAGIRSMPLAALYQGDASGMLISVGDEG